MTLEDEPEFAAALAQAKAEVLAKFRAEICPHGKRVFDDQGRRLSCPECEQEAAEKAARWWHGAKNRWEGVKQPEETELGRSNSSDG